MGEEGQYTKGKGELKSCLEDKVSFDDLLEVGKRKDGQIEYETLFSGRTDTEMIIKLRKEV